MEHRPARIGPDVTGPFPGKWRYQGVNCLLHPTHHKVYPLTLS
jgi:hypothetical protein